MKGTILSLDIFISVGTTFTEEQEQFVQAVFESLRSNGLNPRALGRTDFTSREPLKKIQKMMEECVGSVIIAFERVLISQGIEKRGHDDAKEIVPTKIPTVWNQLEAGMAYTRRLPLFVIVESGIKEEGILEAGYDWWVQKMPINKTNLSSPQYLSDLAEWKLATEKHAKKRTEDKISSTKKKAFGKPLLFFFLILATCLIAGASFYFGYNQGIESLLNPGPE